MTAVYLKFADGVRRFDTHANGTMTDQSGRQLSAGDAHAIHSAIGSGLYAASNAQIRNYEANRARTVLANALQHPSHGAAQAQIRRATPPAPGREERAVGTAHRTPDVRNVTCLGPYRHHPSESAGYIEDHILYKDAALNFYRFDHERNQYVVVHRDDWTPVIDGAAPRNFGRH